MVYERGPLKMRPCYQIRQLVTFGAKTGARGVQPIKAVGRWCLGMGPGLMVGLMVHSEPQEVWFRSGLKGDRARFRASGALGG